MITMHPTKQPSDFNTLAGLGRFVHTVPPMPINVPMPLALKGKLNERQFWVKNFANLERRKHRPLQAVGQSYRSHQVKFLEKNPHNLHLANL
jgi:hypothetical protein